MVGFAQTLVVVFVSCLAFVLTAIVATDRWGRTAFDAAEFMGLPTDPPLTVSSSAAPQPPAPVDAAPQSNAGAPVLSTVRLALPEVAPADPRDAGWMRRLFPTNSDGSPRAGMDSARLSPEAAVAALTSLPIAELMRRRRRMRWEDIDKSDAPDTCLLLLQSLGVCDVWRESALGCVCRVGRDSLKQVLPSRCTSRTFWQRVLPTALRDFVQAHPNTTSAPETGAPRQMAAHDNSGSSHEDAPLITPAPPAPQMARPTGSLFDELCGAARMSLRDLPRGEVIRSQMLVEAPALIDGADPPAGDGAASGRRGVVPPHKRHLPLNMPPPRMCKHPRHSGLTCKQYPFGFSVPRRNYKRVVSRAKYFDWMPQMPKRFPAAGNYITPPEDEDMFREMYASSFFAWSHRRGGWECLRHYDILTAGSIPYFPDLDRMPRNQMAHLPKDLLREARELPGLGAVRQNAHGHFYQQYDHLGRVNMVHPGIVESEAFDVERYYDLAQRILNYTRRHTSAEAMMSYLLKSIEYETPRRVLVIGRYRRSYDYMDLSIISGLSGLRIPTTVTGGLHIYPALFQVPAEKLLAMSREERDAFVRQKIAEGENVIAGAGFQYAFRMNPDVIESPFILNDKDPELTRRILNKEFDLAIISKPGHPGNPNVPYLAAMRQAGMRMAIYTWNEEHSGSDEEFGEPSWAACEIGPIFVREMSDAGCPGH